MSARISTFLGLMVMTALACASLTPATPTTDLPPASPPPSDLPATATPAPSDTPTPTRTQPPTRTPRPAIEGPVQVFDDFSTDRGYWDCEHCRIEQGVMRMGPYPVSGAYQQHVAYCDPCGVVTNYRMAVDVTFSDGQSDRGFGLMVRENENHMYVYEITPWQTLALWEADYLIQDWELLNGQFSGAVRPSKQTNHIGIEVGVSGDNAVDIALQINGRTPLVVFNRPAEPGWVGLTLFGHAMEVTFDNFEFETEETPLFPEEPPSGSAGQGNESLLALSLP